MLKYAALTIFSLSILAFARFLWPDTSDTKPPYRTSTVERATLSTMISATGTLEPCEIIDVGAQVAGRIIEFGIDPATNRPIDYGSKVVKGMVLAKIDPSMYEVEVQIAKAQRLRASAMQSQAEAQLAENEAAVRRSEAELVQQQARLARAEREWERTSSLAKNNAISATEVDVARSELDTLRASLTVAQAAIAQSTSRLKSQQSAIEATRAECDNAQAMLQRAETTLNYCQIVSPIDGTIIDRRVNQGQTVVASLATPSLFLLASDLRQLEIWVAVNEADIGQIKPGLAVRFTVDATPEKTYSGTVKQIRLNASMNQNVVTYTVVVSVDNPEQSLLPYLTANVEFIVDEHEEALVVPNAALRFQPPTESENKREAFPGRTIENQRLIWVLEDGQLRSVSVTAGITEGTRTEVICSEPILGLSVVVGIAEKAEQDSATNPFVPKMPGAKRTRE